MARAIFSTRVKGIMKSEVREMHEKTLSLLREGKQIFRMNIGEPDFDTPQHVKEAAKRALDEGYTHYSSNYGLLELREAIAEKLSRDNGIDVDPKTEVIVTTGASEALFATTQALIDFGDEVLIIEPCFGLFPRLVKLAGGISVYVPAKEEHEFRVEPDAIERKVTTKTKMIIINTPTNPTGSVLTKSDLQAIADMAQEHDLLVVADEIYEKIVFDGLKCTSIASLDGMKERTIMINGFSKTYAMTGWRLGYMAGPKAMVDEILKIHQLTVAAAPTFCQMAGVAALEGSQEPVKKMVSEYQRRRDFAREMLGKTDLSCVRPRGAFYIYPNISDVGLTSSDFVTKLLNETGVAIVPGVAFGDDDHVRISLTESLENLKVAFERILSFLEHM